MPKVYVAGAQIQTGGAYMAYHIGRLLARHFGYALVDVHIYDTGTRIFQYDTAMLTIGVHDLEKHITAEDILVVNPSFSSFLFGLTLPGRKIMYVQDFRTFLLLDCHCDVYVSVSPLVARYVNALYGIETDIIPAFINPPPLEITPWRERPEGSALVYMKNPSREHHVLLKYIKNHVPGIDLSRVIEGRGMKQEDFLKEIASVRTFINLSLAEGFGLVPLEAMGVGTMVTGVDGLAGSSYMRQGENAYTASITDLRTLPAVLQRAFTDEALAQRCVQGGLATAKQYEYENFKVAWLEKLSVFLGKK